MNILKANNSDIPKNYKFLWDIAHQTDKPLKTRLYAEINLEPDLAREIEEFYLQPSLKEALQKQFGISSPVFIKTVYQTLIKEDDTKININSNYLLLFDFLSKIFIKQSKPNHSLFLQAIQDRNVLANAMVLFRQRIRALEILKKHFSDSQILELISDPDSNANTISDTFAMYLTNDEFFNKSLNKLKYNEKNTFGKIHDVFAKQIQYMKNPDFMLQQESLSPALNLINDHSYKFQFIIPANYHTLIDWGNQLGHCIGSKHYALKALKGECILLGVSEENKLLYTLEIINGHMVQIQGKSGSAPHSTLNSEIQSALKKAKLLR